MTDQPATAADPETAKAGAPGEGPVPTGPDDISGPAPAGGPESPNGSAGEPPDEPEMTFSEQLADQLGGARGLVESSIPVAVFVIVNILTSLNPALIASVGAAVAIAVFRLTRKQTVRHAVNGLFGIAIGAFLAYRTGQARDFYLPGILITFGQVALMLGSVAVRRPVVGWMWSLVADRGQLRWREDVRLLRTFSWLTLLWAAVFGTKATMQWFLYRDNQDDLLGVARLAMGYPPYLLLLAITLWSVRRITRAT